MLCLSGHLSFNFWIRTMMTCLHSILKALFCSGLLSIKESDCFRAVSRLTCSASNWLLDFAISIFVTLSAVDASTRTSSFIKLSRSSFKLSDRNGTTDWNCRRDGFNFLVRNLKNCILKSTNLSLGCFGLLLLQRLSQCLTIFITLDLTKIPLSTTA